MLWIIITQLWGVRFTPLSASDTIRGYRVIQTSDGGYAIAGSFKTGTVTYPVYIKMDNNGNVQVVKRYSITSPPVSLAQKADTIVMVGPPPHTSFIFILGINMNTGNVIYYRTVFNNNYTGAHFVGLIGGCFVITGNSSFNANTYYSPFRIRWCGTSINSFVSYYYTYNDYPPYGGPGYLRPYTSGFYSTAGVYTDDNDWWDVLVYRWDNTPNLISIWRYYSTSFRRDFGFDIVRLPNGNFIVIGFSESWGTYVMKINGTNGNVISARSISGTPTLNNIILTPSGSGVLISGSISSQEFIMRMDTNLNISYLRSYGQGSRNYIISTQDGYVLSLINSGNSLYVIKSDTLGNVSASCQTSSLSNPSTNAITPNFQNASFSSSSASPSVSSASVSASDLTLNISPSCYPTPVSANEKGSLSLSNYYKVYTVDGKLVKEGFGSEIKLKRGLYIIKYENKTEKIIIK
jgi:hypothetical protein